MADERRISTTPIPVPMPFGAPQPPLPRGNSEQAAAPPPPVSQTTASESRPIPSAEGPASETIAKDTPMVDAPAAEQAASPAPAPTAAPTQSAVSPAPARTSTPLRQTNGQEVGSRAASQHPDPGFTMPSEAPPHGAPVRQYLNSKVTGVLLEGMKHIAKEQPTDPLRVLGEFLIQRSKELETSSS